MLEKLTPEQESLMRTTRDEWANHYLNSGYETTYEKLRPLIDWCYAKAGIKTHPLIFIADGYVSQKIMTNYVIHFLSNLACLDQVGNQVEDQVEDQVWSQVRSQV